MGNEGSSIIDGTAEDVGIELYYICKNKKTTYAYYKENNFKNLLENGCDVLRALEFKQYNFRYDLVAEIDDDLHNETHCRNKKTIFTKTKEIFHGIKKQHSSTILKNMTMLGADFVCKSFMSKSKLLLLAVPLVGAGTVVSLACLDVLSNIINPQLEEISETVGLALRREISIQKGMKLLQLIENYATRITTFINNNSKIQEETNVSERQISKHITFVAGDINYHPSEFNLWAWATGAYFHLCMCDVLLKFKIYDRQMLVKYAEKYKSDLDILSKKVGENIILKFKNYLVFKKVIFKDEFENQEYIVKFKSHLNDADYKKIKETFLERRLWYHCNTMKECFQLFIDEHGHNHISQPLRVRNRNKVMKKVAQIWTRFKHCF
ncbi:uncharacterized protein LOC122808848 isoform X1 [Protopterus annectens]|uniref:uncharacterized protein LOC122808848 isoform X1 n=1 Tax=Protopterus annectens TaxID=7888 RepID=UPI001CFA0DC0|nr:uncharacterized protein LOC122808848 isoform X1 [Protopterus annectens]